MTNEEKWNYTLLYIREYSDFGILNGCKCPVSCDDLGCQECMFYRSSESAPQCNERADDWLKEEYKDGN